MIRIVCALDGLRSSKTRGTVAKGTATPPGTPVRWLGTRAGRGSDQYTRRVEDPLEVARLARVDIHSLEDLAKASTPLLAETLEVETEAAETLKAAAREAFEAQLIAATGGETAPEEPPEEPAEEESAGEESVERPAVGQSPDEA